ncbi:MAG: DUF1330 domain-containing protein [Anaerolineales bacterium]|nr:DUF1330 domain-containing protein [Anaerolineales bacterium]
MPAYILVDINVHDPARYEDYKALAGPTVPAYDGKYLVRGGAVETLEGDWRPQRLVILEFPSVERAKAWLNSDEYRQARALRHAAAASQMIVVAGVE